jgi:hypothetical protein
MTNGLPAISATVIAATDVVFDPATPTTAYVAFWASGIYKTTNATAANPSWTKLAGGLPTSDLSRIAIAVSPTSPQSVYALCANAGDSLKGVFASSNGGTSWTSVPAAVVQVFGVYTLNVAVDISTPDVVYLSGVSLYKAVRTMGTWAVTEVGANIHPDNHAFASHPTSHLVIMPAPMAASTSPATAAPAGTTPSTRGFASAVRVHRSASHVGRRRDRRDAGQRHRAVPQQPGVLSFGRWRRRRRRHRSSGAAQRHSPSTAPLRNARRRAETSGPVSSVSAAWRAHPVLSAVHL